MKGLGMTISRLCCVLVVALAVTGCGGIATPDEPQSSSQVAQDVTMCELDCPSGDVFTCTTVPCSVTANTITCDGTTTTCPVCVPTRTCAGVGADCGSISDGCGHLLDCGTCGSGQQCVGNTCETACPVGKVDCCGDGICRSPFICSKIGC